LPISIQYFSDKIFFTIWWISDVNLSLKKAKTKMFFWDFNMDFYQTANGTCSFYLLLLLFYGLHWKLNFIGLYHELEKGPKIQSVYAYHSGFWSLNALPISISLIFCWCIDVFVVRSIRRFLNSNLSRLQSTSVRIHFDTIIQ
jgi:hypothetical protein